MKLLSKECLQEELINNLRLKRDYLNKIKDYDNNQDSNDNNHYDDNKPDKYQEILNARTILQKNYDEYIEERKRILSDIT